MWAPKSISDTILVLVLKRVTEERLKAYAKKKAKKGPGPVAKSNVIYDVKPWYSF